MTLNQIIKRIKTIALAHKQIRRFKTGLVQDFFTDKTAKYPSCLLQYNVGGIGIVAAGVKTVSFRMFLVDLVHVSEDSKDNEDDVLSDMFSIINDLVAEINNQNWTDWFPDFTSSQIQSVVEGDNDLYAGWYIDFIIRVPFTQNVCEVPSDLFDYPGGESGGGGTSGSGGTLVYDLIYIANGDEGSELNIPEMIGKYVYRFGIRENNPIFKVSNNPDPAEFTWDFIKITLGTAVSKAGERFLFLYRNN